jgi:Fuc2NAc and GlcNAc transferase
VSLVVGTINLFWLTPIAIALAMNAITIPIALVVAYVPMFALAFMFHAGAEELQ